ncbi:Zinc finger CCHC domain-containing protein 10, partial [Stegodyphus mimosarum]
MGSSVKNRSAYDPSTYRCQKCLEKGHFTYECSGKRKYVSRPTRTAMLNKRLKTKDEDPSRRDANSAKSDSSSAMHNNPVDAASSTTSSSTDSDTDSSTSDESHSSSSSSSASSTSSSSSSASSSSEDGD